MPALTHLLIAVISIISIVFACGLFVCAIEALGQKLNFSQNATGSILAVIGTGLPETIVPIVAILGFYFGKIEKENAFNIAQGAILGSPFMLMTLALFILGLILLFKKSRTKKVLEADYKSVLRNCKYFLSSYFIAILFCFDFLKNYKFIAPLVLILIYFFFVYRTIIKSKQNNIDCSICKLFFNKFIKNESFALYFQLVFSIVILAFASHFFVSEIKYFSLLLNISPLLLSLFITPIATESPEITNSIIWLLESKDELALGNIIGAVVFQATIPFSIAIIFTDWQLSYLSILNVALVMISTIIFCLLVWINKKVDVFSLLFCSIFYFIFLLKVILANY